MCTHTLFKSLPHIFLIHNTPRQTLLLKGKKLLCAELQVVRITAWLMWKDEQHMISTKVFRIKSGPTKVWVDLKKKHTGHDLTYWKYNLRPIITPKSFLTHIHRLSSKKKKAHTPDHTIARYNHCSVCKQCCPGTAVSGSYSVRILQSFVFYLRGLIRERERDWMWWSNTPSANRNTRGEMDGEISALSTVTFPTLSTLEGRAAQPTRRKA